MRVRFGIARAFRAQVVLGEVLLHLGLFEHGRHEIAPHRVPFAGATAFLVEVTFASPIAKEPRRDRDGTHRLGQLDGQSIAGRFAGNDQIYVRRNELFGTG